MTGLWDTIYLLPRYTTTTLGNQHFREGLEWYTGVPTGKIKYVQFNGFKKNPTRS